MRKNPILKVTRHMTKLHTRLKIIYIYVYKATSFVGVFSRFQDKNKVLRHLTCRILISTLRDMTYFTSLRFWHILPPRALPETRSLTSQKTETGTSL